MAKSNLFKKLEIDYYKKNMFDGEVHNHLCRGKSIQLNFTVIYD